MCMPLVIRLIDVDGNDIPYERLSVLPNYFNDEKCDVYTLQLLGELSNMTDTELELIKDAIIQRIHLGDDLCKVRAFIEIIDKIDKMIERKGCI